MIEDIKDKEAEVNATLALANYKSKERLREIAEKSGRKEEIIFVGVAAVACFVLIYAFDFSFGDNGALFLAGWIAFFLGHRTLHMRKRFDALYELVLRIEDDIKKDNKGSLPDGRP